MKTLLRVELLEDRNCPAVYFYDELPAARGQTVADLHRDLVASLQTLASVAPVQFVEVSDPSTVSASSVLIDYRGGSEPALAVTDNPGTLRPVVTLTSEGVFPVASATEKIIVHETALALVGGAEVDQIISIFSGNFNYLPTVPTASDIARLITYLGTGQGSVVAFPDPSVPVVPAPLPIGIGTVDPSTETWYLRQSQSPGAPTITPFRYGAPGWAPVVGNWNGDGQTGIGAVDLTTMTWYLRNEDGPGAPDAGVFKFGAPGWIPRMTPLGTVGAVDPVNHVWWQAVPGGVVKAPAPSDYSIPPEQGTVDSTTATWMLFSTDPFTYGAPGWHPVMGAWA